MPRRRSKTPSSVANKTQGTERSSKNLHTAQAAATTATTTPAIALSSPVASRASFPGAVRHERPSRSSASSPSPSPMDPVFETGFHDLISRNAGPTGVINPDTVWALTRDQMARETSPDDEEEFRRPVLGSQYRREPERDYLEGEHDHLGDEQDHLDREQGSQSRKRRLPHEPIGEAVEEADRRAESPEEDNRDRDTFMFQHQTYRTVQYQTAQFPSGLPLGLYAFAHGNGNAHGVGPYADGPYPDIVTIHATGSSAIATSFVQRAVSAARGYVYVFAFPATAGAETCAAVALFFTSWWRWLCSSRWGLRTRPRGLETGDRRP
ncbi:uncharacterized protein K452DRAFT_314647 [Aplosporella prunicola CBS 121167]|uniref:Uncharacterized protein n=1 Tax=Aplosporella prunicola CBS 121167 TaxID=1176127 RepID=A0A6A6BXD9_9PEZI|nr:uncharacterized protein K452DRAFT_314647 [Aplosporella prunicola CBS 121167]KAF2147514.1 hypothetical protein K452DRAFT_314647 [Aplosporella prunicola CBS 121167]